MKNIDNIKDGEIGLITTKNGRIIQLAITKELHKTIMLLISQISQDDPLIAMGEEYDLVLKSTVKTYKHI